MTSPPEEKPAEEKARARRRGDFFGISALASALLSGLAGDKLSQSLDSGGWVSVVGFSLTILFALIWAIYNAPVGLRRFRRWRAGAHREAGELHTAAEEAEQWLVSLGSDSGGMVAAEWFEQNQPRLWKLLKAERPRDGTADDLARICDALEAWYVRRREPWNLLKLSDALSAVADGCRRPDLAELAAARAATAYRLMGDLETADYRLSISEDLAPARRDHRTAAALVARRQVERALLHLARAETAPPGNDRADVVLNASNRLDDARLSRPGPDLAAEIAILINLGIVRLYQQDPEGALDQLQPAAARATAAGDASGRAHAHELMGVAAWMLRNPDGARESWEHAEHLYAEIEEREGQARCLQHLGSAEVVAGRLEEATTLLEESASWRGYESPTLVKYLAAARKVAATPEVADEGPCGRLAAGWIRRLIDRWLLR